MSQDRPASVQPVPLRRGLSPPIPKPLKEAWISGAKGAYCRELAWRCNLQSDSLVLIADRLSGQKIFLPCALRRKHLLSQERWR